VNEEEFLRIMKKTNLFLSWKSEHRITFRKVMQRKTIKVMTGFVNNLE